MHCAIIRLPTENSIRAPAKRAVAPELSRPDRANGQVFCLLSVLYYFAGIAIEPFFYSILISPELRGPWRYSSSLVLPVNRKSYLLRELGEVPPSGRKPIEAAPTTWMGAHQADLLCVST
jgi:hypothetical protein